MDATTVGTAGFKKLVLASQSPRRADLLTGAGYSFEIVPSEVDEIFDLSLGLPELTRFNARLKARAVAKDHPDRLIIGADTLVYLDGAVLGKPLDLEEAAGMLRRLSGRTHRVCTAVCLYRLNPSADEVFHAISEVTFRQLDEDAIREYFGKINPLDKAGGYAAQDYGEEVIERVDGSWSNVVGLPLEELASHLEPLVGTSTYVEEVAKTSPFGPSVNEA